MRINLNDDNRFVDSFIECDDGGEFSDLESIV